MQIERLLVYHLLCIFTKYCQGIFRGTSLFMHRIFLALEGHFYDDLLGIETIEFYSLKHEPGYYKTGVNKDGNFYQPTSYRTIKRIAQYVKPTSQDVFADIGCGKGRAVCLMATKGLKRCMGIELKKELADIAQNNAARMRFRNTPIKIINQDALHFDFKEVTVFYLFNPFGLKTMEEVIRNIKKSLDENPRKIWLFYRNPILYDILNKEDWLVFMETISRGRVSVWMNK